MKNYYEILFGSVNNGEWKSMKNATKQEIVKAYMLAIRANMKSKKYSPQELTLAQRELLDPSKRFLIDFIFTPTKYKTKRVVKLEIDTPTEPIDLTTINENAFDNLDIT
jgi:hypothetical protein